MNDLSALSVREYAELLGSDRPSPGGGSAAALVAALGAGLGEMTCRINAKRKSNTEQAASLSNAEGLARIRKRLVELVTLDAQTYEKLSAHWKAKSPELPAALKEASKVPLEIVRLSFDAIQFGGMEINRTSKHLISDLAESAVVLFAALQAAKFNVEINLRNIDDAAFTGETSKELEALHLKAAPLRQRFMSAWDSGAKP